MSLCLVLSIYTNVVVKERVLKCCRFQVFSQTNSDAYQPPTKESNELWLNDFQQELNTKKEWLIVKDKILADSSFWARKLSAYFSSGKTKVSSKVSSKANCECKILFLLVHEKEEYKVILDLGESPEQKQLLESIKESSVKDIFIADGKLGGALFGVSGRCGAVIIHTKGSKFNIGLPK